MSETASEPKPSTECPDGMVWDAEAQECVPKADTNVVGEAGAATAQKGLFPAVRETIKEAGEQIIKEMEQKMQSMMKTELAKIQQEFAVGLRKELGLTTDPTVTKTELDAALRKAVLDLKVGDGKKTPASAPLNKSQPDPQTKPGDIFKNFGKVN